MQESSLLALHLHKSRPEAIMRIPTIVTYAAVEKEMEYKGEQSWALVEPWCKYWSCCGWWKGTSRDEATSNNAKLKPIALMIIELCLSEGISKGVSQSVENSTKLNFFKIP